MDIVSKLDKLAEIQAHQTIVNIDYEDKRKVILAKVQDDLDALDAEFTPMRENLSEQGATLESEIKADVLSSGGTVKGAHLMAVWSKGRVSWDTKQLDGLMLAFPQLAQCRKEGDPSVSIRKSG